MHGVRVRGIREDDRLLHAGRLLLASFVAIELRAKAPLVRLSIFRTRSLLTANVSMFLAASAIFAMFFFNTLYLQRVLVYGPLEAGLAFLPFTAGIMVSAGLASQFAPRVGVRPVAAIGMLLTTGGLLLLTQLPVHGSYVADVLPALLLSSLGMGAVFMPLTLIATTGLKDEDQGLASGLFNTSQQSAALSGSRSCPRSRRARWHPPAGPKRTRSWSASIGHSPQARSSCSPRSS